MACPLRSSFMLGSVWMHRHIVVSRIIARMKYEMNLASGLLSGLLNSIHARCLYCCVRESLLEKDAKGAWRQQG